MRCVLFSVGDFTTKFEVRDCIPDAGISTEQSGCHDEITGPAMKVVNGMLSFLEFTGMSVDGKSCYCNTDLCDAQCEGLFILDTW